MAAAHVPNFYGIALYTIEPNGCLTGVYSNTGLPLNSLYNEIGRKAPKQPAGIEGMYKCAWIDLHNVVIEGSLEIIAAAKHYDVVWKDNAGTIVYNGSGFMMSNNTFAVYYTK